VEDRVGIGGNGREMERGRVCVRKNGRGVAGHCGG
jgi:hypothetical protein